MSNDTNLTAGADKPAAAVSPEHMRLVLIDDEPLALKRLHRLLKEQGCRSIMGEFNAAADALNYLHSHVVDAVFVDLRMPGMDGLELIGHINQLNPAPAVVVTTAWLEHALEAYGPVTVSYLLKPVEPDALAKALGQIGLYMQQQRASLASVDDGLGEQAELVLVASQGRHSRRLQAGEVSFFKAENKYVCAYMKNLEHYWLNQSLNQLMTKLEPLFVRIHRNAAVNVREIERLRRVSRQGARESMSLCLGIRGYSTELEVSRNHHRQVRAMFKAIEAGRDS
ncbi:MAG: LytTR family DNA-binding domain-containing protein [Proteobacteria bacterium]|nr:LytTR family DNA-binding domain-containing protein [Pseudomonadota bacterium]